MPQINGELLQLLIARTSSGDARWARGANSEQFVLKLQSGSVLLVLVTSAKHFRVLLLNTTGEVIEGADVMPPAPLFSLVNQLWGLVLDHTFRISETAAGIMNELRRPGPIGGST